MSVIERALLDLKKELEEQAPTFSTNTKIIILVALIIIAICLVIWYLFKNPGALKHTLSALKDPSNQVSLAANPNQIRLVSPIPGI